MFIEARLSRIALAFAIVYVVWGSTYLAIRIMVGGLPPALSAGVRFLVAAALMFGYAWLRGDRPPSCLRDWRNLAITGVLMLGAANGIITWAEQWVPSNQAALIIATAALWIAWFGTWGPQGQRLNAGTVVGLVLGFVGVAVLIGGGWRLRSAPAGAYLALVASPVLWAAGSIYAKRAPVQTGPIMAAAVQTLAAGVVLTVVGLAAGDAARWSWQPRALAALGYLIVFGSCLGYGAYFWLVHAVPPALLGTYAYVNPAVAILLGWLVLGETLSRAQLVGSAIILLGVLVVTWAGRRAPAQAA